MNKEEEGALIWCFKVHFCPYEQNESWDDWLIDIHRNYKAKQPKYFMIPASHVCILSASLFNNVHLYNLYSLLKSGYFFPDTSVCRYRGNHRHRCLTDDYANMKILSSFNSWVFHHICCLWFTVSCYFLLQRLCDANVATAPGSVLIYLLIRTASRSDPKTKRIERPSNF